MIHWLTTLSPKLAFTHAPSAITGWKLHAVEASDDASLTEIGRRRALCGLRPRHGWTVDLFIEERCQRCERARVAEKFCQPESAIELEKA